MRELHWSYSKLKLKKNLFITTMALILALVALFSIIPPVWELSSSAIAIPSADHKSFIEIGPRTKRWTPFNNISKHTIHAFIAAEDARFFEHQGFDVSATFRSLKTNIDKGKIVRGGSTITQQVIKLAFLGQERTFSRKAKELLGAILAEALVSKEIILEWYLNLVPLGPGIYGVKAAAKQYYNTSPDILTIQQSVNLALILPRPNYWSKGLDTKKLTEFGHKRFAQIVQQMYDYGYLTHDLKRLALATGDFGKPVKTGN